jgi:hypothetical protein
MLGNLSCHYCINLPSLIIPDSITNIGTLRFDSCKSLRSVGLGHSLTAVPGSACYSCTQLTGISIPDIASGAFYSNDLAVAYELPNTDGWFPWFGGIPLVLWNSQAQIDDANFGVRNERFGFTITGSGSIPIVVGAGTNLANTGWVSLQSCTLTNVSICFSDPKWTKYPARC